MAQEKQEKPEKAEKKDAAKAAAKLPAFLENKVLLLGGVVVLQALLAIGITQFVIVPRLGHGAAAVTGEHAKEPAEAEHAEGVLVSLNEIIASLRSEGGGKNYVRTSISVEVKDHEMALVIEERLAQLRDSVIMTVSQRTAAELTTPEGTKALREELTERLAEHLPEGALLNIYFSDLVIQ
jgi:flagellar FliL protein